MTRLSCAVVTGFEISNHYTVLNNLDQPIYTMTESARSMMMLKDAYILPKIILFFSFITILTRFLLLWPPVVQGKAKLRCSCSRQSQPGSPSSPPSHGCPHFSNPPTETTRYMFVKRLSGGEHDAPTPPVCLVCVWWRVLPPGAHDRKSAWCWDRQHHHGVTISYIQLNCTYVILICVRCSLTKERRLVHHCVQNQWRIHGSYWNCERPVLPMFMQRYSVSGMQLSYRYTNSSRTFVGSNSSPGGQH